MSTTGDTVSLAEWIIDNTCLVSFVSVGTDFIIKSWVEIYYQNIYQW